MNSSEPSLLQEFRSAVAVKGETVHLTADGSRVSLRQLSEASGEFSAALRAHGIRDGSRVVLLMPNGVAYAVAFFAALQLQSVIVPIDPQLTPHELANIFKRLRPNAVCVDRADDWTHCVEQLVDSGECLPEIVVSMLDSEFEIKRLRDPRASDESGSWLTDNDLHNAAAVFFTSGTSGSPKAVVHTEKSLMASVVSLKRLHSAFFSGSLPAQARRIAIVLARHGKRLLSAMGQQVWYTPLQFSTIAGHEVFLGSLLAGHSLVTTGCFHPRRALHDLADERINIVALTPAHAELLLLAARHEHPKLPSLLIIGLGGDSVSPDLTSRLRQTFQCAVTIGYGSTELGGGILATRLEDSLDAQSTTVGQPFPGSRVRILTKEGADAPPGQVGELLCQTDGAASVRYLGTEKDDNSNADEFGWRRTGDLALFDEHGNVRIIGRISDTIIRGGRNIRPREIEDVINQLPGVSECGVVGASNKQVGQQIWAFIVLNPGVDVSRQDVQDHCRSMLAPFKLPDHIRFISSLPRSSNGKLKRFALALKVAPGVVAAEVAGEVTTNK